MPTNMLNLLGQLPRGALDAVLPRACPVSNAWLAAHEHDVSSAVAAELDALAAITYCPRCGRNAPPETLYDRRDELESRRTTVISCGGCDREHFWSLRQIARVGPYDGPLRTLLVASKFAGRRNAAAVVAAWLAQRVAREPWLAEIDAFVPIPMARLRRWQRPCDHARLLAEFLGQRLRVPVRGWLRRPRYRPSQTHAESRTARFDNVRDCFAADTRRVTDKTICLVDNVATSGATLVESARTLKRAGARAVYAAIAARAHAGSTRSAQIASHPV